MRSAGQFVAIAAFGVFVLAGCNAGKDRTNIEIIQNMMDQTNIKAQEGDPANPEIPTSREPAPGSIPRGYFPMAEELRLDPEKAGRELKNPLAQDFSPETLSLGKQKYDIYCAVCHGNGGAGDGTVSEKMAVRPPSVLTQKVRDYPDGRLYHIITIGQGVMGNYASQIQKSEYRWAIVNYMRTLQKKSPATEAGTPGSN